MYVPHPGDREMKWVDAMVAPGGVKEAADAHYAKRLSGGGVCGPGDGETKWADALAAPGGVKVGRCMLTNPT